MPRATRVSIVASGDGMAEERVATFRAAAGAMRRGSSRPKRRQALASRMWAAACRSPACEPGEAVPAGLRPSRSFFVEPHGGAAGGDGSELQPWDDWATVRELS